MFNWLLLALIGLICAPRFFIGGSSDPTSGEEEEEEADAEAPGPIEQVEMGCVAPVERCSHRPRHTHSLGLTLPGHTAAGARNLDPPSLTRGGNTGCFGKGGECIDKKDEGKRRGDYGGARGDCGGNCSALGDCGGALYLLRVRLPRCTSSLSNYRHARPAHISPNIPYNCSSSSVNGPGESPLAILAGLRVSPRFIRLVPKCDSMSTSTSSCAASPPALDGRVMGGRGQDQGWSRAGTRREVTS